MNPNQNQELPHISNLKLILKMRQIEYLTQQTNKENSNFTFEKERSLSITEVNQSVPPV